MPTQGRASISRALKSIEENWRPGDESIVVADTHGSLLDEHLRHWVEMRGHTYLEHDAGHHCWGHCQLNHGMKHATGDYLVYMDDDDVFAHGAWNAIRETIAQRTVVGPILFQFKTSTGGILWQIPGSDLAHGRIGGHCLVQPNDPERMGFFSCEYAGDLTAIQDACQNWGHDKVLWMPHVISIARPR